MEAAAKAILKIDKTSWTPVKFGDVAFEPKENAKDIYIEGIEHVVGLEHIETENIHLTLSGKLEESTTFSKKFKKGDVLFGRRRAYLKKAALASFDGICSGDITVFRAKKNLLPKLLPFIVNNEKFFDYAVKHSAGGLSPRVKFKDLANYEFLLPPKDQQAQLAELLWAMDEVIEREKEVLEMLWKTKSILQRETFEKTISNYIEIQQIAKVYSGGTPNRKVQKYWNGNIPWIKTAEVNYQVINQAEEYITEEGLKNSAAKLIPAGSILVAMYGQGVTRGRVGMTGIEAACNQACAVIDTTDTLTSRFIYSYLEYKYDELRSLAHGANQQNLNLSMIKEFKVPDLNKERKEIFLNKKMAIDENINNIENKIVASHSLQKSLINQIF